MLQYLLLLSLASSGCGSTRVETVQVNIPKGYTGWVFMVAIKSEPVLYEADIDTSGVGYISRAVFDQKFEIRVVRYEDSEDISSLCRGHYTGAIGGRSQNAADVHYGAFYLPSEGELDSGDAYLAKRMNRLNPSDLLDSLIEAGRVHTDTAN